MKLSDFDYDLPEDLIAQRPLADRASSRLLWLHKDDGCVEHRQFRDVGSILQKGDLLVLNTTRVTARRLLGTRSSGGPVEALVLRRIGNDFEALTRPAKKLRAGDTLTFTGGLTCQVAEDLGSGLKRLHFQSESGIEAAIQDAGTIPLPPYVRTALGDEERYQTVYSADPGSAAAPTAGLHFTAQILDQLRDIGVQTAFVNLDIGLDTFRPVTSENIEDHQIHGERCSVGPETSDLVKTCKGRIIAVGTTSARTLETFAVGPRELRPGQELSRLFITPGYEFKIIDGMFTNFHMPKTTMLFMVAALVGRERLMEAYAEAVRSRYRFLSFGDSMLVL